MLRCGQMMLAQALCKLSVQEGSATAEVPLTVHYNVKYKCYMYLSVRCAVACL